MAHHSVHRVIYQNGDDLWPLGDTQWNAFGADEDRGLDRHSMQRCADARAGQGYNVVQTALEADGAEAFASLANEQVNPAYWKEVDRRLADLDERGLSALIVFSAGGLRWADFPNAEARQRFVRYIAGRYSAHNVMFDLAADWRPEHLPAEQMSQLDRLLDDSDPHERLIGVHTAPDSEDAGSAQRFQEQEWFGFGGFLSSSANLHRNAVDAYVRTQPNLHTGLGVWGDDSAPNSGSLEAARHSAWDVAMAGFNFVTAFESTYQGGAGRPGGFEIDAAINKPYAEQIQHLRRFFNEVAPKDNSRGGWRRLLPMSRSNPNQPYVSDELIESVVPRGEDVHGPDGAVVRPPKRAYWAVAKEGYGHTAAIYARGYAGPHHWRILEDHKEPESFAPERIHSITLFDPRTGEVKPLPEHRGPGPIELVPPDARDWVFLIRRMNPYQYEF